MPDRFPYEMLSTREKQALHDWCTLHDVDYQTVPIDSPIVLDEETGEWLIEVFKQRDGHSYIEDGEIAREVLRRPWKADLPWPTWDERLKQEFGALP